MNIKLDVSKDFERFLDMLRCKYGEEFEILNGIHESQTDPFAFQRKFLNARNVADASIDSNANEGSKDIQSMQIAKTKSQEKLEAWSIQFDTMKRMFGLSVAQDWLEAEYSGLFYGHDAHTAHKVPYCFAYDLTRLAEEGLFFINNYNNRPPKHLTTFFDDVIEYISYMSNRSSGAVGVPNILIWSYYFWKHDCENGYFIKSPEYYAKQNFQKLIYRLNQPFMRITQCAFTNVSVFDRNYVEALFGGITYPDGTYVIDQIEEIMEHQKLFMEVVSQIRTENLFTYPVLTFSLLYKDGRFQDEEFARWASDHNTKWNDSNFFVSSDVSTLSNCCRLLSQTTKLTAFVNSIGGTSLSIGSQRVNTTNLMRVALMSDRNDTTHQDFLDKLRDAIILSCKYLQANRQIIRENIKAGLLPNYVPGGVEEDKQYSTIGILGCFEAMQYFDLTYTDEFGYTYYTDAGVKLACDMMKVINQIKDEYPVDFTFNIESVPAERAAVILCQKDNLLYNRNENFIYSNQWIPLTTKCTIEEKLRLSAILDVQCGGGAIAHINLESNFPNKDVAWDMLNRIAQSGVIYFAFNTRLNECKNHHGFVGTDICPTCGEGVADTYQRIVGYLVPTRNYSKDRFKEFSARKWYKYADGLKE